MRSRTSGWDRGSRGGQLAVDIVNFWLEKFKGGVAFIGCEEVGGDVNRFKKFVYGGEESFGVGGARVKELGVIGGAGFGESILVLLQIVCVCWS